MIIARSPLRISLGGGGTDLASYYQKFGGFLIAAAIDKYVYLNLHRAFEPGLIIKYSKMERAASAKEVQHPIIREALMHQGLDDAALELTSLADIPAGTGLGSSGSFTTALLNALHTHNHETISPDELAEEACHIEIDRLGEPIGKQDQYIASVGGITAFTFNPDGKVDYRSVQLSSETRDNLEDNLLLFFTGFSRSASNILRDQHERSKKDDTAMLENLHATKQLGFDSLAALESGNLEGFADLMNEHWQRKQKRSDGMSNSQINTWYEMAMKNGAMGGKLIGAGGGGFLMFYAQDKTRLRSVLRGAGLREVRFRFDFQGSSVMIRD